MSSVDRRESARRPGRRRGSVYLLVLGVSMLVYVIGVSAILAARVQHRAAATQGDAAKAYLYARSAINLALHLIDNDSSWRTTYGNSAWPTDQPIGDGSYTIEALDEIDGDVTNGDTDPLVVTGIGMKGNARQKIQVKLVPQGSGTPLDSLTTAIHSGQTTTVDSGVIVNGAPLSSNQSVLNDGTITGDVEAVVDIVNDGTITGTVTAPVPLKSMPPAWAFDALKAMATPIPLATSIDKQVLSPGSNPWGVPDPDGIYFIDTGASNLVIQDARIHGTLVVKCGGTVVLDKTLLLQSYRADLPVLIVDGNVDMQFKSQVELLDEVITSTNFNPPGSPYAGVSDSSIDDTYPNEIQGLVHVIGGLKLKDTAQVRGVIVCEGTVTCDGNNEVIYDATLFQGSLFGYSETVANPPMMILPGTWAQAVD